MFLWATYLLAVVEECPPAAPALIAKHIASAEIVDRRKNQLDGTHGVKIACARDGVPRNRPYQG
jgi:hypothetical protein